MQQLTRKRRHYSSLLQRRPLLLGLERNGLLENVLSEFELVQDVIGLIQKYAKQEQLLLFPKESINRRGKPDYQSKQIYFFNPSASSDKLWWTPFVLSQALGGSGGQSTRTFMKNETTMIIVNRSGKKFTPFLDLKFNVKEYDVMTDRIIKCQDYTSKDIQYCNDLPNVTGLLEFPLWAQSIFYNVSTNTFIALHRDSPLYHHRLFFSSQKQHGDNRLFVLDDVNDAIFMERIDGGKFEKRSQSFWPISLYYNKHWGPKYNYLAYNYKIYMIGSRSHACRCLCYDMLQDVWEVFPSLPSDFANYISHLRIVVDNHLLLTSFDDHIYWTCDLNKINNGWQTHYWQKNLPTPWKHCTGALVI